MTQKLRTKHSHIRAIALYFIYMKKIYLKAYLYCIFRSFTLVVPKPQILHLFPMLLWVQRFMMADIHPIIIQKELSGK